jgi:hypothetical protein
MMESLRTGDRLGWRDEDGFQTAVVREVIAGYGYLVEMGDRLYPINVRDVLPPF